MILSKIIADISREENNNTLYALAVFVRIVEVVAILFLVWLFISLGSVVFQ